MVIFCQCFTFIVLINLNFIRIEVLMILIEQGLLRHWYLKTDSTDCDHIWYLRTATEVSNIWNVQFCSFFGFEHHWHKRQHVRNGLTDFVHLRTCSSPSLCRNSLYMVKKFDLGRKLWCIHTDGGRHTTLSPWGNCSNVVFEHETDKTHILQSI